MNQTIFISVASYQDPLLFFTLHLAAMRNEILRRRVRMMQIMQAASA